LLQNFQYAEIIFGFEEVMTYSLQELMANINAGVYYSLNSLIENKDELIKGCEEMILLW
jgi:hypothetical protein